MKVIITGATGVTGGPLVKHCIQNTKITRIFVLARRALHAEIMSSPKVTYIQHQDFSTYSQELLQELAGVYGCIWTLGGSVKDLGGNYEIARKISVDWPIEAARAFATGLQPHLGPGQKFKFVFVSMRFVEYEQNTTLYFMGDSRRLKGQAEMALIDLQSKLSSQLSLWCVRPSGIIPENATFLRRAISNYFNFISAENLGASLVSILLHGHPLVQIENEELHILSSKDS